MAYGAFALGGITVIGGRADPDRRSPRIQMAMANGGRPRRNDSRSGGLVWDFLASPAPAIEPRADSPDTRAAVLNVLTKPGAMKPHACLLRSLLLATLACAPVARQSVAPPPAPAKPADAEPIETLSPFVVQTSRDTGYQATSTLAGTRLNTPVKDLAASISIYTKDFIEDVGATSSSDLLIFATGTDAAGAGGNYSGANNDINEPRPNGNSARIDPQGTSRSRGLAAPTFTRGYFATSIPFDSYNTGTVTVNRGPNSALFGVGSAAGVIDTALDRAGVPRQPAFRRAALRQQRQPARHDRLQLRAPAAEGRVSPRLAARARGVQPAPGVRGQTSHLRRAHDSAHAHHHAARELRDGPHPRQPSADFTALQQRARRVVCRRPAELRLALLRRPRPQPQHDESRHRHRGIPPQQLDFARADLRLQQPHRYAAFDRVHVHDRRHDRQCRQRRQVAGLPRRSPTAT